METTQETAYRRYWTDIVFQNGLAGGRPPEGTNLVETHIALFSEGVSNALKHSMKTEGAVTEEAMRKYVSGLSAVFPIDEEGIYITDNQITAMMKDAAQVMKATLKTKGLTRTVRDGGVIAPPKIHLGVSPTFVERPVKPDNGPANIKKFQVAEGVALSIPIAVLDNGDLPDKLFREIWRTAQNVGVGAQKHLGYGKFRLVGIRDTEEFDMEDIIWGKVQPRPLEEIPPKKGLTAAKPAR